MAAAPELIPEAPLLIEALPSLTILAALLFIVGLIYALRAFVEALFGSIASLFPSIPGIGNPVQSAIHSAEQAISNKLGEAESYFDAHIAAQFHRLAGIVERMVYVLEESAVLSATIARWLTGAASWQDVQVVARDLRQLVGRVDHIVAADARAIARFEQRLERSVAHGVYPRIRSLEHEVGRTLPREIARTRDLAKRAEAEAARAWDLVKTRPWEIGAAAFAGAVAIALSALDLGWLRCSRVGSLGRALCGIPGQLLEDLLGLLGDYLILTNICDLVGPVELAFEEVAVPLADTVVEFTIGTCGAEVLPGRSLAPPAPVQPTYSYAGTLSSPG